MRYVRDGLSTTDQEIDDTDGLSTTDQEIDDIDVGPIRGLSIDLDF